MYEQRSLGLRCVRAGPRRRWAGAVGAERGRAVCESCVWGWGSAARPARPGSVRPALVRPALRSAGGGRPASLGRKRRALRLRTPRYHPAARGRRGRRRSGPQVGPPLLPGATPSSDAVPRRSAGVGFALGTAKRFLPSPPPPEEAGRRSPAFVSPRCCWVIRRPVGSLGGCCGWAFLFRS